jgi:hypothetical protein
MENIVFVDINGNKLFEIPDGGHITVGGVGGQYDGEVIYKCRFVDENHFETGEKRYSALQFAEEINYPELSVCPEPNPEYVGSYKIICRIFVNDKVYEMAESETAVQKFVTWQGYKDKSLGHDWGHYWTDEEAAFGDLLNRADAEKTGECYDYSAYATAIREKTK